MGLLGGNWELTTVKHGDIIGDMFFVCFFCPDMATNFLQFQ